MSTSVGDQRDPQTYAILGALMEVHRRLGHGFLEAVYQEATAVEFTFQNVPFAREVLLAIRYRESTLDCRYRADFVCFGEVLVELKALDKLTGIEEAQVINYLKATGFKRALLVNFGAPRLEYKRMVLGYAG